MKDLDKLLIKLRKGFTLMEVVTVVTIIIILSALLMPALKQVQEKARHKKAEAMIGSLEVGVNMYYTDIGNYPPQLRNLTYGSTPTGYGPYMDNKDFNGTNFLDPWGNAYSYNNSSASYNIYTTAPDGTLIKVNFP